MTRYENNKLYQSLSKKEKEVFDLLGSLKFRTRFSLLDFEKKVRLISAAENTDAFFDKDGNAYSKETEESIRADLSLVHYDILFLLYDTLDLFWTIHSENTDKPYLFRRQNKSGEDLIGIYLFTEEHFAEKKIKKLKLKGCYVEPIDAPYEFIRNGFDTEGYGFVELFTRISSMKFTKDDVCWSSNAYLTSLLNEYAQIYDSVSKEDEHKLKKKISEAFSNSKLLLPAWVDENALKFHTDGEMIEDKKIYPAFTTFVEYSSPVFDGEPVCMYMQACDAISLADDLGLILVVNPDSAFFIVDEEFKKTCNISNSEIRKTTKKNKEKKEIYDNQ